jgi:hypothetical protein
MEGDESPSFAGLIVSEQLDEEEEEVSLLDTIGGTEFGEETDQLLYDIEADELGRDNIEDYTAEAEEQFTVIEETHENGDTVNDQRNQVVPRTHSIIHTKKKIKNRHVKAAVMIAVVWLFMIVFLVAALSVDWWKRAWYDVADLCTLCSNDTNVNIEEIDLTEWPTRKPSSSASTSSLFSILGKEKALRPPPENIAEVCSPSIYVDHGPNFIGLSRKDLISVCANSCFPGKSHLLL